MSMLTLDSILLSTLVVLLSFVVWSGHRYISRDDAWKASTDAWKHTMERRLAETANIRNVCIQDFALKKDVNELFGVARDHGERIASLEAKTGK